MAADGVEYPGRKNPGPKKSGPRKPRPKKPRRKNRDGKIATENPGMGTGRKNRAEKSGGGPRAKTPGRLDPTGAPKPGYPNQRRVCMGRGQGAYNYNKNTITGNYKNTIMRTRDMVECGNL